MNSFILLTGGAGFIGSHTYIALVTAGYTPLILDNLCNSHREVIDRLAQITGKEPMFIQGDVRDSALLNQIFKDHLILAVIHFAGLKAVGESTQQPLQYYENNVFGSVNLLQAMQAAGIKFLIFSSSATVYGNPARLPISENFPRSASSPYGRSKLMVEDVLSDLYQSDPSWKIACLRYFNPVGAHESGLIGEAPQGIPNNLMPYLAQVAIGKRTHLQIFGNNYLTPDGTGVRDYIHVMDLAEGHVAALCYLNKQDGFLTANLGTGQGISVLELVQAFESASGQSIPYKIVARRPGDTAACWTDPSYAQQTLGWKAHRSLQQMCIDTWRWQKNNPNGYL